MKRSLFILCCLFCFLPLCLGQTYTVSGKVVDKRAKNPIEFATLYLPESEQWTVSGADGHFSFPQMPAGKHRIRVQYLGYATRVVEVTVERNISNLLIALEENNLTINEVVVTAQKQGDNETTSYVMDRNTLDHAQIINVSNITTLLPGGKSVGDQNLASSSNRIALHAGSGSEMGNASFGTAIAVDGMRLENNATLSEIKGVDLRNVGASNIESIEVVTGIPSVEYGDLSNGIVKINTRKGRTPFIIELSTEPKTKQIALSKGLSLRGGEAGTLNFNLERTRSVSNLASPYTAYERNNLNLTYTRTFKDRSGRPLILTASLAGNVGGYDSEADPDEFQETYTRTRDYAARGNLKLNWLLDKSWITNLMLQATASYSDKLSETNANKSTASTQPYIHSTEAGYYVGQLYDSNPSAEIILSPVGYWYLLSRTDSKPVSYSLKAKADWSKRWGDYRSRLMVGTELNGTGNLGRGLYYDDMRYAPTWREYRYDELPFMNNLALFAEEKFSMPTGQRSSLQLTAGLRQDITLINRSEYGTPSTLSPRLNLKYNFWENRKDCPVSDFSIYGGWGKSVKLPSFSVLYPSPTYSDRLAFAPGTTADGTTFYAYYTQPTTPSYNADLKWQHTEQSEIGLETKIGGTRISVSAYRNKTFNPYMSRTLYTPFTYKLTTQADIEVGCTIPSANRQYTIDRETGVVTVKDATGVQTDQVLGYSNRNVFVGRTQYTNGSPVERRGIDFIVDFAPIKAIGTTVRIDGNYYRYKGVNETLVATTGSASSSMDGTPYKYIGYFAGSTSAGNGSIEKHFNTNLTIVTHIPKVRMIFSVRVEATFLNYKQSLSEYADGSPRGYLLQQAGDFVGTAGDFYNRNSYVAVYPEYYATWENPDELLPFAEKFLWAKENDPQLYSDLAKLVTKSNTSYYFDENRLSAYYAANFNLTKEIGKWASITFYARNFFYHMGKVRSSQTGLETSLYDSGYIPKFYYGLSLRLKL
ncbi:MAG: TonB-dependent receptor [Bacteroides sp.]|nr:TonB-dependent receptor [Bacteroides sp.]